MKYFSVVLLALIIWSCSETKPALNKFEDDVIVKIHDFKDRRLKDSLYIFLKHENPVYRKEAVLAFGSIQDTMAIPRLSTVLIKDESAEIRKAVAFAFGQTRSQQSRLGLLGQLIREKDEDVKRELIQAYGKITSKWILPKSFKLKTDEDRAALAWTLYAAGLNGLADSSMTSLAAQLITPKNPESARLGAAHYFSRSAKDFQKYFDILRQAALNDGSVDVRMAATSSLRKIVSDSTLQVLTDIIKSDADYRIKVNAVRSLQAFPFDRTKNELLKEVDNSNTAIAVTASEVVRNKIDESSWIGVGNKAGQVRNWRVRANLYEAVLKVKQFPGMIEEVKTAYAKSTSPYEKAALITALQNSPDALDFIIAEFEKADTAVVKTSIASAVTSINANEKTSASAKSKLFQFYKGAIADGDPGVIGTVASALANPDLNYKSTIKDLSFLYAAKEKLSLPKDIESIQPLENAIAYLEGKEAPKPAANEFNHPIDWNLVKTIPADQEVFVYTSKGKITLRLLVEEAPGSVANFVSLARANYFDHKAFHRVVPNFVIQGGCNRGDGSGSEDYSIRSEFSPRHYKTGSVGMASAGKDTEGTQWFITHSPTPHLDGRYTIFAEVTQGMEVVHQIEMGDEIMDVVVAEDPNGKKE
jgi:cyclophilin family peptidyl-prolyl cis-trans isomerase/HEAT repeat protein